MTSFFIGGVAGVCLAITGLITGVLLLLGLFAPNQTPDHLETGLLILAFPFLILAAHSLDKAAEAKKAIHSLVYKEQK